MKTLTLALLLVCSTARAQDTAAALTVELARFESTLGDVNVVPDSTYIQLQDRYAAIQRRATKLARVTRELVDQLDAALAALRAQPHMPDKQWRRYYGLPSRQYHVFVSGPYGGQSYDIEVR